MTQPGGPRRLLESLFRDAVSAVEGGALVDAAVQRVGARLEIAGRPLPTEARLFALAVGKAALPMARAFETRCADRLSGGIAVTTSSAAAAGPGLAHCALHVAAHPVPDARSVEAATVVTRWLGGLGPEDVLCVLLSGGASSLLARPLTGLTLADLAATTRLLLRSGADIGELNTVRKHLAAAAGGRLARGCAAGRIELLAISDVPGDRIDVIGSGPFCGDPSSYADAVEVVARRELLTRLPPPVRAHLEAGARGERPETPKPGAPDLARVRATLLASNRDAVAAARAAARARGLAARVVSEPLAGEARDEAGRLVSLARRAPRDRDLVLVAGGESTVTVTGNGRGGRNQELALAAALELDGNPGLALLAAGTDGADGPTPAAGAYADGGTRARAAAAGRDAAADLAANDSHAFFCAEGGVFHTGPTGTNVCDLALLAVAADPERQRSNRSVPGASKSV